MSMFIRLDAGHTPSGNPQRVYVVFNEDGDVIDVFDEGYTGNSHLMAAYPRIQGGVTFSTSKTEYRELLKLGKQIAQEKQGVPRSARGRW